MIHDDLTKAVGQVIERVSTPRMHKDACTLTAPSTASLIFVATLLLVATPPDALTALDPRAVARYNIITGAISIIAILLVTATFIVMTREHLRVSGIALTYAAPFLTVASTLRLGQSHWDTAG